MSQSKAASIAHVCTLLSEGKNQAALDFLRDQCVAQPVAIPASLSKRAINLPAGRTQRRYSSEQKTRLFLRDGFADRYSGEPLVFPGVLRLLSYLFPETFPYHPNWKYTVCHAWYWELYPTVDHVDSAGDDSEENWVTTSMIWNLKKSNIALQEHGWHLREVTTSSHWDGLIGWYGQYISLHPELLSVPALKQWSKAANKALDASGQTAQATAPPNGLRGA